MDRLKPTSRNKANVEAEKGETVVTKFFADLFPEHYEIDGKKHKDGGTPLQLPSGSFIFSDAPDMKIKDKNVLNYLGEDKAKTVAEIAKKYDLNKFKKILTDPNVSPIDRNSALVGMSNNLEKLGFLALYQEMMKGLPDGVPEISQEFLRKNPEYVEKVQEMIKQKEAESQQAQQADNIPKAYWGFQTTMDPNKPGTYADYLPTKDVNLKNNLFKQEELKTSSVPFKESDFDKMGEWLTDKEKAKESADILNKLQESENWLSRINEVREPTNISNEIENKNAVNKKDDPLKGYSKEEIEKMIKEGKIKADVKNYNMSLVFPGGYRSMMMDKMAANYANWLEGTLQSAYMAPMYNANRVFGSHSNLSRGDYVQAGTRTGDFKIDKYSTNTGYDTFTLPYYPSSHPQMSKGGQFDPAKAIKEIYERLSNPVDLFEEGGETGKSPENPNNTSDKQKQEFNNLLEEAYNDLLSSIEKDVDAIYEKMYSGNKPQNEELAKENIKKLIISAYNAAKQGLQDTDKISFSKQTPKGTANLKALNAKFDELLSSKDKGEIAKALKLNAVNVISNFNPEIFKSEDIGKALRSGNVEMNKDVNAAIRKEYYDAWGLSNYGDPKKVKDDLGVALFQHAFINNAGKDTKNIVVSHKGLQGQQGVGFAKPVELKKSDGLKSGDISAVDGYLGDRTVNQLMLDLSQFAKPEEKKQEVKPVSLPPKQEIEQKPQEEKPKQKARGYYFLQDKNKIALALHNLYSIRKRPPYEPEPVVSLPDYSLYDPNRALQAMQQSYKTGMDMQTQYSPAQIAASNIAAMSSEMASKAADVIANVQNQNVGIANMASANTTQLINAYLNAKGNQMRSLHDKYTAMEERYTADRNKALANLTSEINNAITNAAKAQTINEILYKDSPYYIEPETGGTTHFDPRYAKEIVPEKPQDKEVVFNRMMEYMRKQGIDHKSWKPEDYEKFAHFLGLESGSSGESIDPAVKREEKEKFTPWWQVFPFSKTE